MIDLRTALRLDAGATAALGVLLVPLAGPAERSLGIPAALTVAAGLGLLAWAMLVAWVSTRPSRTLVIDVVVGNALWVAASLLYAVLARGSLTGLGIAFVVAQAAVVLVLLELQILGVRRSGATVNAS